MKYMVLIYSDEKIESELSADEWKELLDQHNTFATTYGDAVLSAEALEPTHTGKTLRRKGEDVTLLDGPFAETKEQLGGFYLLEAASIDEAAGMARDLPLAEYSSIEIRPVMDVG